MSDGRNGIPRREDRMIGAKIVDVTMHANRPNVYVIEFEHRGTDDDEGYMHVAAMDIHFGDDDA